MRRAAWLPCATLAVACTVPPGPCPEGARAESGVCVPASATACAWDETVRRTRLCVDRSTDVRVTGTCAEDRTCACEDVDYCAPTRVGRAVHAVERNAVPIAAAAVLASAAIVIARRRRRR